MSTIAGAMKVCAMERRNKRRASTANLPANFGERLRTRRDVEDTLRVGRPVVNIDYLDSRNIMISLAIIPKASTNSDSFGEAKNMSGLEAQSSIIRWTD